MLGPFSEKKASCSKLEWLRSPFRATEVFNLTEFRDLICTVAHWKYTREIQVSSAVLELSYFVYNHTGYQKLDSSVLQAENFQLKFFLKGVSINLIRRALTFLKKLELAFLEFFVQAAANFQNMFGHISFDIFDITCWKHRNSCCNRPLSEQQKVFYLLHHLVSSCLPLEKPRDDVRWQFEDLKYLPYVRFLSSDWMTNGYSLTDFNKPKVAPNAVKISHCFLSQEFLGKLSGHVWQRSE